MTWVKICGMTNLEDALVAVDAGADAVGFVFYGKSPRCVTVERAGEIAQKLPESVEKVGVFVGEPRDRICAITQAAALTSAQIYPDFQNPNSFPNDEFLENLPCTVIVALSANQLLNGGSGDPDIFTGWRVSRTAKQRISGVLLDSGSSERPGGTGRTFQWSDVGPMVEIIHQAGLNLFVAGGLTAKNVGEAIQVLHPSGVDVASGVEASPGKKDPAKVRAFVRAVRELDRRVG